MEIKKSENYPGKEGKKTPTLFKEGSIIIFFHIPPVVLLKVVLF